MREHKGKNMIALPNDYTVIDIETTGLSTEYDSIIELAAVRVRNDEVVKEFQCFVDPGFEIPAFVAELTGITNEMIKGSPDICAALSQFVEFVGDDVVIGHNVSSFDMNFIYDNAERCGLSPFSNDHVDTLRLYRKLFPEREHHRLKDMVEQFSIPAPQFHRALADVMSTYSCFVKIKSIIREREDFVVTFNKADAKSITAKTDTFDETHPLYNKSCVFTGTLEKMTRAEAMQIVVDHGGKCENNVTRKTNFLIMGNLDYCSNIKGEKSSKMKKAESYMLQGYDISILPESVFYDLIEEK